MIRKIFRLSLIVWLLGSCTSTEELDALKGDLSGEVVDKATGRPLEGVTVLIGRNLFATTDASGKYVFDVLFEDSYTVSAEKSEYDIAYKDVSISGGRSKQLDFELNFNGISDSSDETDDTATPAVTAYPFVVRHESYEISIESCKRSGTELTIGFKVTNTGRYTTVFSGESISGHDTDKDPTLYSSKGDVIIAQSSSFGTSKWGYDHSFASNQIVSGTWTFENVPSDISNFTHLRFRTYATEDSSSGDDSSKDHIIEGLYVSN